MSTSAAAAGPADADERAAVDGFLARYAAALSSADLDGVSACYCYPSFVLGEATSVAVPDAESVRSAFAGAASAYAERGLVGIRGTVRSLECLSPSLLEADVTWDYLASNGEVGDVSAYRYLLRRCDDGALRIHVVTELGDPAAGE